MIEIWANEECTERPVINKDYEELYVQVNESLNEQCPTPVYASDPLGIEFYTCPESHETGEEIILFFGTDWAKTIIQSYEPADELTLEVGVYKVTNEVGATFIEGLKTSIGPVVKV